MTVADAKALKVGDKIRHIYSSIGKEYTVVYQGNNNTVISHCTSEFLIPHSQVSSYAKVEPLFDKTVNIEGARWNFAQTGRNAVGVSANISRVNHSKVGLLELSRYIAEVASSLDNC